MIVGIDEVGRGCWAGPLVAGAVILNPDAKLARFKDSKKLTKQQREAQAALIRAQAIAFGLGWVTPAEIDDLGLTQAVRLAMERALYVIDVDYGHVLIDGNYNFLAHLPNTEAIIKADETVPAVSAASTIAKVARDTYMANLSVEYDAYGFSSHVGYGTRQHQAALKQFGVSNLHRRSFKPIQALLQ